MLTPTLSVPPTIVKSVVFTLRRTELWQAKAQFAQWGEETLQKIFTEFETSRPDLFSDERSVGKVGRVGGGSPAFMWGCGEMLSALVAATKHNPTLYRPRMESFITALDAYWNPAGPVPGYDVLPLPKPPDRYYDDNAWVALALLEAYDLADKSETKKAILQKARQTLDYVLSGEDTQLSGGLYWREHPKDSKNTCANAPGIVAALRFYQLTHEFRYRDTALRLYRWTNANLLDTDGLYFDHLSLTHKLGRDKWSYNTALMIEANLLFYQIEREEKTGTPEVYLVEARRLAKAAEANWFLPDTGAMNDEAFFGSHLSEALLTLAKVDNDPALRERAFRALQFLGEMGRGTDGYFPTHWSEKNGKRNRTSLLDQASAARAFLFAANIRD